MRILTLAPLGAVLTLCWASAATAQPPRVVELAAAECPVTLEYGRVPPETGAPNVRIRPSCPLSPASTRWVVGRLLEDRGDGPGRMLVEFGRLVDYPYLSRELAAAAAAAPDWNARTGRARAGSSVHDHGADNAVVARLLRASPAVAELFRGWRVENVSVEKVLVGPDRLPYDALVGLRLEKPAQSP